jgi:hypothetical protein
LIKDSYYPTGGFWTTTGNGAITIQYYDEVLYLKFNDSTEVAMSTYFSEGFDNLELNLKIFLKAFER